MKDGIVVDGQHVDGQHTDREAVTVLICDDHELVADGLAAVLQREDDITVVGQVGTMADAVAAAEGSVPDVVVMDFRLPDGTGAEATAAIKVVHPTAKVLLLTSHDDDAVLAAALESGCVGFLTKNRPVNDIVAAVRRAAADEALITTDLLARLLPQVRSSTSRREPILTPREQEVLELLSAAATNDVIAQRLFISVNTVRNHVANIMAKLNAHSRLEAVVAARRLDLL